jgi:alpha-galactosidase
MVIIGCNTFSHLSAGIFELYRSGDDTSGRNWDRTRRMGVNTLAFRAAQHRHLYMVDPDIVAITKAIPWELNEQWLRLVSASGAALFVSVEPEAMGPAQDTALAAALANAARPQPTGEPVDWMQTVCPREWTLRGKRVSFNWIGEAGSWPFGD